MSDSVTPWTVALQAPLSMGFAKQNTGMGSHSFLQEVFLTQGSNLNLPHCRQILYHLSNQGSPIITGEQQQKKKKTLQIFIIIMNHVIILWM